MCRALWRNDLTPMVLCHEPEYVFGTSNDILAAFEGLAVDATKTTSAPTSSTGGWWAGKL